jgi:hypothetical protein
VTFPTVTDEQGRAVTPGTRVRYYDHELDHGVGTVTGITDWDADYDDNLERPVTYPPRVVVRWDGDTAEESFTTSAWETAWVGVGPDVWEEPTTGVVEELEVVTPLE